MSEDTLRNRLAACSGKEFQTRRSAPDPVSSALIRRWLEAFGDANPVYLDEAAAKAAGHAGAYAPSAMMPAFTARSLSEIRSGVLEETALGSTLKALGFITPGTGIRQVYEADILVGDILTEDTWPESISDCKETRLGTGYFITYRTDFSNQYGRRVGIQQLSTFAFQPGLDSRTADNPTSIAGDSQRDSASDRQNGESLPPREITLDRMGIIACTTAMGDFNPTHYDPELAAAVGFKDIFTDIYSSTGFVQSYIGNWAGPMARITSVDIKLGMPLYPGDTLYISGTVTERNGQNLTVVVRGVCASGMHLAATARLVMPSD